MMKQIRLSQRSKEKLSRLKGKTGIKNWNILCRWALCYSLSEKTIPTDVEIPADSNLEMSWYTFGGEYSDLYDALVRAWCIEMGLPTDDATLQKYFHMKLESAIAHRSGTGLIQSSDDLISLVVKEQK